MKNFKASKAAIFVLTASLLFSVNLFADLADFVELRGVAGLRFQTNAENVILTWTSDSRESFAVMWRSNASIEAPWITLTNMLPAALGTSESSFCDVGVLTRSQQMQAKGDLNDFYHVFVIPDFWFDLENVTLNGDAQNSGRDFLPFYYGNSESDSFKPEVELLVDGQDRYFGEEDVQRVNFGSPQKPRWTYASGFWFRHDLFANGRHTLQIRALLTLNNSIGQWSQFLTLTNKPVHVWITNDISFVGFPTFVGKTNATFIAQSAEPRVDWQIDVYDSSGQWLVAKHGRTSNGDIHWTWDLRDANGYLHDNPDDGHFFKAHITTWPLDEPMKSGQLLTQRAVPHTWSDKIFGRTQNKTSAETNLSEREIFSRPLEFSRALTGKTNPTYRHMVLDLGETSHYIKITPEYSNAVLKAVLPLFSEAAEKLNLPVPKPIAQSDIAKFQVQPFRELTAFLLLKDGWVFEYSFGHVQRIQNLRGYAALQDPDQIPRYYGEVRMSKDEAVQMARHTLIKLGIPLEDVFAEQEPRVTPPPRIGGTNIVPHYEIEWITPLPVDVTSVDIHINAETKQIERIYISNKNLGQPLKLNVVPTSAPLDWPSVNPDYARQLIPMMFKAVDEYAQKLALPIPRPLNTNNVARVEIHDNEGWPHAGIETTNGWRFIYRHTMVNGYYAPDNLFASDDRKIHIKDFDGKWNLTTNQAIAIIRQALKKLDYPTNHIHMDDAKTFIYTAAVAKEHIPRLNFQWYYEPNDDLQSRLEAEVNMDTGKLESLYYDDLTFWGSRPPIDVPISVGKH